jgi:hypothetical protein
MKSEWFAKSLFMNVTQLCYLIRFTYQVVVRAGPGTREDKNNVPIIILEAEQPPILVHPSHLGGVLSAGHIFNIGVRLKTKQVS